MNSAFPGPDVLLTSIAVSDWAAFTRRASRCSMSTYPRMLMPGHRAGDHTRLSCAGRPMPQMASCRAASASTVLPVLRRSSASASGPLVNLACTTARATKHVSALHMSTSNGKTSRPACLASVGVVAAMMRSKRTTSFIAAALHAMIAFSANSMRQVVRRPVAAMKAAPHC